MNQRCWQILGIEPTEDQQAIRAAYRSKLPDHHPENDPSGFQLLRQAFEHARKLAETPFMLRSAQSTEDDGPHDVGTAQLEQAPEPPPSATEPLFESMLAQFDALLNTPKHVISHKAGIAISLSWISTILHSLTGYAGTCSIVFTTHHASLPTASDY